MGVGDHGHQHVGHAVVLRQLHRLGVDHQKAHLFRGGLVEHAQDQGVDAHGLARSGGAGDEQMGHLGQVRHHGLPGDIPAQGHGELALGSLEGVGLDQVPHPHGIALLVGDLDAHRGLPGDGRLDAHAGGRQVQGQVVGEVGDLANLHPGGGLYLIPGDSRSPADVQNLGLHPEALQGVHQHPAVGLQLLGLGGGVAQGALRQHGHRGEHIGVLGVGRLVLELLPGGGLPALVLLLLLDELLGQGRHVVQCLRLLRQGLLLRGLRRLLRLLRLLGPGLFLLGRGSGLLLVAHGVHRHRGQLHLLDLPDGGLQLFRTLGQGRGLLPLGVGGGRVPLLEAEHRFELLQLLVGGLLLFLGLGLGEQGAPRAGVHRVGGELGLDGHVDGTQVLL